MAVPQISEKIFADALALGSSRERQSFIDEACAGDTALRAEVESLLNAYDEAGPFMADDTTRRAEGAGTARFSSALPRADDRGPTGPAHPAIAGFRIERILGRGGLGTVYEAWDEKLQRKVALKTLHSVPDAEVRRRVLDEARKTAGLRDPALVTVHAVLDEQEPAAIVMELVEGVPVDQYADSLTFEQKARVLQEIARALGIAHRHGVIHRDLKPANVLVTPALRPVILDFGLALSLEEANRSIDRFEGTPLYCSPEQAVGKPLSAASDIFSFGSLMFKVLTGTNPFTGTDVASVLRAICAGKPPFPRDLAVGVPADLQAVCLACLATEVSDRPTAEVLVLELGRFLTGEPVRLRPALYGDILRQRISDYDNDLINWQHQGMISGDEKDRLQVVHRRILSDEDHWLIDTRRLTLAQTVLYTSTWLVVVAAGLMVWLVRTELSPALQWILPVFASAVLVAVGLLAHWRREPLASASFLAGAILSVVPAALSILPHLHWWSVPAKVQQLFPGSFTNQQVLAAFATGLTLSVLALWRLRMSCFAWTTCLLGAAGYFGLLLQWDWLAKDPETKALWLLPLTSFSAVALRFESIGRIRWTLPFHLVALIVLIVGLDVMAGSGPTFAMLGLDARLTPFLNHERQEWLSFALNGALFLALMLMTENARSLDLRRGSRLLEIAAILHLLGSLYQNANMQRDASNVVIDVSLYLAAVLLFLVMGPWRARWRMLVGALSGVALGSYLLIDLNLVPKTAFVLCLGAVGLVVAVVAYVYLLVAPRWAKREPK